MIVYLLLGLGSALLVAIGWRRLYPSPYPGIPFNEKSANRVTGDIPDLVPIVQATNEFSYAVFSITTWKLGVPIAQLLLPAIRRPLIILDDPREIEDILVRRNKEFDKAPMVVDNFSPIFPHATLSQFTTPVLKAQKRLWADGMTPGFLHKAAAPNIHKATLELIQLWRLKASTIFQDKPFDVYEDLQNAALDAIWVAVVGEEPGITRYEINKLQRQQIKHDADFHEPLPPGIFLKKEVAYIADTIARSSNSPSPKWAQKLETYTPRYRSFRRTIATELGLIMRKAVERFQHLEMGKLEATESDTCMMDLILRRRILDARKTGKNLTDPTKDQSLLDEMFIMLVAGHDSTANTLAWFVRFMEAYPEVQVELRTVLKASFPDPNPSTQQILETDIPYLDAVCEETFRFSGVAKGSLRRASIDTQILGCKIPKGAQIFMNYHVNHTPAPVDDSLRTPGCRAAAARLGDGLSGHAGRNLETFEPRRWLVDDGQAGKATFNAHALPSLAFGGGYRGCFGRKLASMEFRLVITLLVLNLEFLELPEDLRGMHATEKIFRKPDLPFAKLKVC